MKFYKWRVWFDQCSTYGFHLQLFKENVSVLFDKFCVLCATVSVCILQIIYHGMSADTAYLRIETAQPPKFIGFRDAALGEPTYLLHLHDVLRAVEKVFYSLILASITWAVVFYRRSIQAIKLKWFDIATFDADEYELYERVENGDMNWIIPGKILSFCGPHNESRIEDGEE